MALTTVSAGRLTAFLKRWKSLADGGDAAATQCQALFCVFGDLTANTLGNQRGQAALQYLFNAATTPINAAMVITDTASVVIVGDKASVVPPASLVESAISGQAHTVIVVTPGEAAEALRALLGGGKSVGAALRELEIQEGDFARDVTATVKGVATGDGKPVEAAALLGELLFVKDAAALGCVQKAAALCTAVFRNYARESIEEQIQAEAPTTLHEVREKLCEKLERPSTIRGLENLKDSEAEFAIASGLTPCIFHKGAYLPQIQVDPTKLEEISNAPLRGDVVVVRFGAKNNGYTAFFARTLIIKSKAPANALDAYDFIFQLSEKIISLLIPGARLQGVYADAVAFAKALNPTFAEHLPKSLGFSTGLLVLESRGTISDKGSAVVANDMAFVVRVALEAVQDGDAAPYAVELADTVVVEGGVAKLKTKVARKPSDITYEFEDNEGAAAVPADDAFELRKRDLGKITRGGQSATVVLSAEAQRDETLKRLLRELHAEFLAAGGKKGSKLPTEELRVFEVGRLSFGEVHPFQAGDQVPPAEARGSRIHVQTDKKVVWLPIFGNPTPFHISTISKVETKVEGERYTFNVVFHTLQEANVSYKLNRTKVFLKELNYAASTDMFADTRDAVQAVQQRIKNADAARKRESLTAKTENLKVQRILALPDVKLRPPVSVGRQNKGCVGSLELHLNGLRFIVHGIPPIDLPFENVKHLIFQPAVQEISVIYHITLKKAIDINRKAVTELQFIADVMESSELASGVRRSHEEEIRAEERDEQRVRETNKQLFTFAKTVEKYSKINTQLPSQTFHFDGVHTRSMVKFRGSKEVLWAVSEWPPFTLAVEEAEVVSFERVLPGGSTFDVTFVMKDYNRPVVTINSIPKQFLEAIKDWSLNAGLYYMETSVNPNWKVTLKDIRDDAEWDPWLPGAGWSVLNNNGDEDDEEGGSDSEDDSTYYEDEDEEDTDSDDDSSWLESDESDDKGSDDDSDASDASSAASWDELERRAEAQDRRRGLDDDEDDRPRKKARGQPPVAPVNRGGGGGPLSRPAGGGGAPFGKTAVPPPRRF